jgi:carboxyl-terminal processing protease
MPDFKESGVSTMNKYIRNRFIKGLAMAPALGLLVVASATAQTIGFERERGRQMLNVIKADIKKNYYDPTLHGIDIDARFKAADEKIKQAGTVGQVQAIIAQTLIDFDDSHLFFIPPEKANRTEYGWRMKMVGDKPMIIAIQPGSDAEAKGLKPGDEIYSIDGFGPTRDNFWKMKYFYYALRPKPLVKLVLFNPEGVQREVEVRSKVKEGRRVKDVFEDVGEIIRESENEAHLSRHRFYDELPEVFIWKMPQFDLSESEVDSIIDRAKKHKAIIIDLRGNGGGLELTQLRLVGNFFDHDIKVGDIKRRTETKPLIAKTRGANNIFKGQLVVIVDSESGSSSEIFARVIQMEKRGVVVGDRTAGAVMRARQYQYEAGLDVVALYGVSITDADLIMTDGKSLEKRGVTPDELLLVSPAALSKGRDPVLARAAALVGAKLDPEKAGSLFPIEWRKD